MEQTELFSSEGGSEARSGADVQVTCCSDVTFPAYDLSPDPRVLLRLWARAKCEAGSRGVFFRLFLVPRMALAVERSGACQLRATESAHRSTLTDPIACLSPVRNRVGNATWMAKAWRACPTPNGLQLLLTAGKRDSHTIPRRDLVATHDNAVPEETVSTSASQLAVPAQPV